MAGLAKGNQATGDSASAPALVLVFLPLLFVGAASSPTMFSTRRVETPANEQHKQEQLLRQWTNNHPHETKTFRSPAFSLGRGDVIDSWFRVEVPRGHIAIRNLEAHLVDESGNPISLGETYLNRWGMERYYIIRGSSGSGMDSRSILVPNAGVCQHGFLSQSFLGLGSDNGDSNDSIPAPYGIVVGNPEVVPFGFEEAWFLSVHAIDTRGAVNSRACMECVCELYNVTTNIYGDKLPVDYEGGMFCCHDGTQCLVQKSNQGGAQKRKLFLEYTVTWVNMTAAVLPARVYLLDVTDSRTSVKQKPACLLEYAVDQCREGAKRCIHTTRASAVLGDAGFLIMARAHQRSGGAGMTLSLKDGWEICSSLPIYGRGAEAKFVMGMTSCYPEPGSVRVSGKDVLRLKSLYNNEKRHTGAIGVFRIVVADTTPRQNDGGLFSEIFLSTATIIAAIVFACMTIWRFQTLRRNTDYVSLTSSSSHRSSSLNGASSDRQLSPDRLSLNRTPSLDRMSLGRPPSLDRPSLETRSSPGRPTGE